MVEAPLTPEERATLTQQLKRSEAALAAMNGITGIDGTINQLVAHIATLRQRLHRAKPLAERREALAAALLRRETAWHDAQAALLLAQAKETECRDAVRSMREELHKLDTFIDAEVQVD